ncbi:MAG TPA: hypothetical protein VF721_16725 [Pyrinomonadaceae bacterium]
MIIPHWLYAEIYYLIYDSMVCLFPFAFVFFLVLTIGLRDFEYKLNFREIVKNIFRKLS